MLWTGLLAAAVAAAPASAADPRWERAARLGKLWSFVRYFHPDAAAHPAEWEAALVRALPAAERASTPAAEAAVASAMLAELHDPATAVEPTAKASLAAPSAWPPSPGDGLVLIDASAPLTGEHTQQLDGQLAHARGVLIDLRGGGLDTEPFPHLRRRQALAPSATRVLHYDGFPNQDERLPSGGYQLSWLTQARSDALLPAVDPKAPPVVLLLGPRSALTPELEALVSAGNGFVVADGAVTAAAVELTQAWPVATGFQAVVRTGAQVLDPRAVPFHVDLAVRAGADARAEALRFLRERVAGKPLAAPKAARAPPAAPVLVLDPLHADTPFPSRELRLLAAFRFWAVVRWFTPYRELLEDWDAVLLEALPQLAGAADLDGYVRALSGLSWHLHDTHTLLNWDPFDELIGTPTPLVTRWVEGKLAIAEVRSARIAAQTRLAPGDVVVRIDGEPAAARAARLHHLLSASTEAGERSAEASTALHGAAGTVAHLEVQKADGTLVQVDVPRDLSLLEPGPARKHVEVLPGNIGLLRTGLLDDGEVEAALDAVQGTRALILDLRDNPHFSDDDAFCGRLFQRAAPGLGDWGITWVDVTAAQPAGRKTLPRPALVARAPTYAGRIVALIGEAQLSHGEDLALKLEAVAPITFVGAPTSGADGMVTRFSVPGGATVDFTGARVAHVDGRPLQRRGLQPDVPVEPTLAGLRAGRDEVLERALRLLTPR